MKVSTSSPSKDTPKPTVPEGRSSGKSKGGNVKTVNSARKRTKHESSEQDQDEITSEKVGDDKSKDSEMRNHQELSGAEISKAGKTEDRIQKMGSKFDVFKLFCKLCDVIASVSKYTEKTAAVKIFINKGTLNYLLTLLFFGTAISIHRK